jgi:hypothetical protein
VSRNGRATLAVLLIMAVAVIAACAQKAAETSSVTRPASHPAAATSHPAAAPRPSSSPSAGGPYRYTNARFGFSFDVPVGYTAQPPPENGDGLSFTNATEPATVTAYGENNVLTRTPSQELAELISTYQSAGDTITYRFAKGDVIAVSGTTALSKIFYHREIVYPAVLYALLWTYPASARTQYDPLVTQTVDSFTPGPIHSG